MARRATTFDGLMETGFWEKGGLWATLQWLLMGGTLAAGPLQSGDWSTAGSRPAAVLLLIVGATFGIAGTVRLGRNRTILPEPKPGSQLITQGIYAWVRHPLYTSVILLSFAWAIAWQSLPALVLALATTGFLDAKSRHEETRLRKHFPDYPDYARHVKRLIPFLY
jgi:protein-S-isoprenylcysteine O-methyltransferase Ste14